MNEISETGYWNGETAHIHHVHSEPLAQWIAEFLKDYKSKRVYDLGCGMGNYLKTLEDNGFNWLIGMEGDIPKTAVFDNIRKVDLTQPTTYEVKGHVITLEVMEHIPSMYQDIVLDNIKKLCSGYLIMSWAVRGQAGFGHVNCLDNHEVIPIIEALGFTYLEEQTLSARSVIDDTTPWFRNTILIFKKA